MAFGQPYQYGMNPYMQNYGVQQQYVPQQPIQTQQQMNIPQQPSIFGKIVDGEDLVRSFDVPIGYTYIFPQANGEIVYSKGWTDMGTTFIKKYVLSNEQSSEKTVTLPNWDEKFTGIYDYLGKLEKKLDDIKSSPTPMPKKKKVEVEVDEDDE